MHAHRADTSTYNPGSFHVFVDNASIHKGEKTRAYAAANNIQLIYNVSYRPDLNGIEGFWREMKKIYRS